MTETVDEYLKRGGKMDVIEYNEPEVKAKIKKELQPAIDSVMKQGRKDGVKKASS